jgi:hypothetical protein
VSPTADLGTGGQETLQKGTEYMGKPKNDSYLTTTFQMNKLGALNYVERGVWVIRLQGY